MSIGNIFNSGYQSLPNLYSVSGNTSDFDNLEFNNLLFSESGNFVVNQSGDIIANGSSSFNTTTTINSNITNNISLLNASNMKFYEPTASGSNYTEIKAQAQSDDIIYILPSSPPDDTDDVMGVDSIVSKTITLKWKHSEFIENPNLTNLQAYYTNSGSLYLGDNDTTSASQKNQTIVIGQGNDETGSARNICIGDNSFQNYTSGSGNERCICIGHGSAKDLSTGNNNVLIRNNSLTAVKNTVYSENVVIGGLNIFSCDGARDNIHNNIVIGGKGTLEDIQDDLTDMIVLGSNSLTNYTEAGGLIVLGNNACQYQENAINSIVIGHHSVNNSGYTSDFNNSIIIGHNTFTNVINSGNTSTNNIIIGSGVSCDPGATNLFNNVVINAWDTKGVNNVHQISNCDNNVIINCPYDCAIESGSDNTIINSSTTNDALNNSVLIGGGGDTISTSNRVRIGNTNSTSLILFIPNTASSTNPLRQGTANSNIERSTSSKRYKEDIEYLDDENVILKLKPCKFKSKCSADRMFNELGGFYGLISEDIFEVDKKLCGFKTDIDDIDLIEKCRRKGHNEKCLCWKKDYDCCLDNVEGYDTNMLLSLLIKRVQILDKEVKELRKRWLQ